MRVICWLRGHLMAIRHREPVPAVDDGGWGLHFLGPDPIAHLYRECVRCGERDRVNEYPIAADNWSRWMRGEEPTIEPASAPTEGSE